MDFEWPPPEEELNPRVVEAIQRRSERLRASARASANARAARRAKGAVPSAPAIAAPAVPGGHADPEPLPVERVESEAPPVAAPGHDSQTLPVPVPEIDALQLQAGVAAAAADLETPAATVALADWPLAPVVLPVPTDDDRATSAAALVPAADSLAPPAPAVPIVDAVALPAPGLQADAADGPPFVAAIDPTDCLVPPAATLATSDGPAPATAAAAEALATPATVLAAAGPLGEASPLRTEPALGGAPRPALVPPVRRGGQRPWPGRVPLSAALGPRAAWPVLALAVLVLVDIGVRVADRRVPIAAVDQGRRIAAAEPTPNVVPDPVPEPVPERAPEVPSTDGLVLTGAASARRVAAPGPESGPPSAAETPAGTRGVTALAAVDLPRMSAATPSTDAARPAAAPRAATTPPVATPSATAPRVVTSPRPNPATPSATRTSETRSGPLAPPPAAGTARPAPATPRTGPGTPAMAAARSATPAGLPAERAAPSRAGSSPAGPEAASLAPPGAMASSTGASASPDATRAAASTATGPGLADGPRGTLPDIPRGIAEDAPAARAAPASTSVEGDSRLRFTLLRYRGAHARLDAGEVKDIYPNVDDRALAERFAALQSQNLTFDNCDVRAIGTGEARAVCRGKVSVVPRAGSRKVQSSDRQWTFALRLAGQEWLIVSATER